MLDWTRSVTSLSLFFQLLDDAQLEFIREAVEKIGIPTVLSGKAREIYMKQLYETWFKRQPIDPPPS